MHCVQSLPLTDECDADVIGQCTGNKAVGSFAIGEAKACLVSLGVPQDPSIMLAAEVMSYKQQQQYT